MAGTLVSEYLPYVRCLQDEHRKIGELIDQVQEAHFLRPQSLSGRRDVSQSLLADLRSLRRRLQTHFNDEESGGALEEAISRLPRLTSDWRDLKTQHRDLLDRLDGMIETVESQGSGQAAEAVERSFDAFTELLYDHEMAENRLLEQGFNVGSEDDL